MSDSACRAVLDSYDSQHRCSGAANHDGPHCQWAWPCDTHTLATTTERKPQ